MYKIFKIETSKIKSTEWDDIRDEIDAAFESGELSLEGGEELRDKFDLDGATDQIYFNDADYVIEYDDGKLPPVDQMTQDEMMTAFEDQNNQDSDIDWDNRG